MSKDSWRRPTLVTQEEEALRWELINTKDQAKRDIIKAKLAELTKTRNRT